MVYPGRIPGLPAVFRCGNCAGCPLERTPAFRMPLCWAWRLFVPPPPRRVPKSRGDPRP